MTMFDVFMFLFVVAAIWVLVAIGATHYAELRAEQAARLRCTCNECVARRNGGVP